MWIFLCLIEISIYKNESLFPLVTVSHVNDWTDLADSFLLCLLMSGVDLYEIKNQKNARKTRKFRLLTTRI